MSSQGHAPEQASARLCLNMIVRNEAAIIERCLASVSAFIDCWVILDTGSDDRTPELIECFFQKRGIPGQLHRGGFTDFSTTRNESLELCRQSPFEFDFILLIDADMELVVEKSPWPGPLDGDAYLLRQTGAIVYDNVRLVHRNLNSRYRGVTHEFLDTGVDAVRLDSAYMVDYASGANRAGKAQRDIALLTQGLKDDPGNARYLFYLAQSFKDAGDYEQALTWYLKRIEAEGWVEERWYARYQAARCLLSLGRQSEAVAAALRAWDDRPWRSEPLALLCSHYRESGRFNLCCEFAAMGLRTAFPEEDRLFIETSLYEWGFQQELSISGFYARDPGFQQLGRQLCHRLSQDWSVPVTVRDLARNNLRHYSRTAADWPGMEIIGSYHAPERAGWASFNPSIFVEGERRALILRQANYRMVNRRYVMADGDKKIRTVNYLVELDRSFRQTDAFLMQPSRESKAAEMAPRHDFPVQGYEDCRLFRWRDHWWASATVRDTTPDGVCEMVLLRLDDRAGIRQEYVLRGAFSIHHQKNWMPFVEDDQLHFIYSLDPVRVLRFDRDQETVEVVREHAAHGALEHLRGGGQLARIEEGYLGICHQACGLGDSPGAYLHRFFTLDDDFRLNALSDVFSFTGAEVEFCAGLALDPGGDCALVSFGVDDCSALLASIPLDRIQGVLRRLA